MSYYSSSSSDRHYSSSENGDDAYDCKIEFDGASKGNPGKSGAGAILRDCRYNTGEIRKSCTTDKIFHLKRTIHTPFGAGIFSEFNLWCIVAQSPVVSVTWHLREGLGFTTGNVAEYRGLILGLKTALRKGYRRVDVYGDSFLVYNQVIGKWGIRNRLRSLNDEVQDLIDQFALFRIQHIRRVNNQEADYEANEACRLRDGCMWED